jgi:hypothetical protein
MPITDSTWEQGGEQESTVDQLRTFLHSNRSDAYTVEELVDELGPADPSEGVIAYYRALLELLVDSDQVAKRRIEDAGAVPYYRAKPEQPSDDAGTDTESEEREMTLDIKQPLMVDITESSAPLSVRRADPQPEPETPFFVRWYRWYQQIQ